MGTTQGNGRIGKLGNTLAAALAKGAGWLWKAVPVVLAKGIEWFRKAVPVLLAGLLAVFPLFFVLQNDRDLQRTELGTADQHAAYTDLLNAADAAVMPQYVAWDRADTEGGQTNLTDVQRVEISRYVSDLFPDQYERARTFRETATRLRLVIPADDAHLISTLSGTLTPEVGSRTPTDLLSDYTKAKLALVNEFRTDVLGEKDLPDDEAHLMTIQTLEDIRGETGLLGAEFLLP